MNKAIVSGNLGRNPESKLVLGKTVCTFTIASSRKYKNQAGETVEQTEWFNIETWGRLAEICGQYLAKGRKVLVEGRMSNDHWTTGTDDALVHHNKAKIVATSVEFLGTPNGGGATTETDDTEEVDLT